MNRNDVTEKIITVKVAKGIQWADVANQIAACMRGGNPPRPACTCEIRHLCHRTGDRSVRSESTAGARDAEYQGTTPRAVPGNLGQKTK